MDASLDSYYKFLNWTSNKGLIKPVTVKNWLSASRLVFESLDDAEKIDLRSLDLDSVFRKFSNLHHHKYNPKSIHDYKSRLSKALAEFNAYVEEPGQYRPLLKERTVVKKVSNGGKNGNGQTDDQNDDEVENQGSPPVQQNLNSKILVPVPIRPGLIVEIRNLPSDLSPSEADKIAAVIKAFAFTEA